MIIVNKKKRKFRNLSFSHKENISKALEGKPKSEIHKENLKLFYINNPEIKINLKEINLGKNNPNFGKHESEEKKKKRKNTLDSHPEININRIKKIKENAKINPSRGMKGHNFGVCRKCNKMHKLPMGMLGKKLSSEVIKQLSGSNSHLWKGGISFELYPPEFNKEFKNLVRLRDNFCCLNCGTSEQKHIILFNKKLHIHHINYNKKNTCLYNCCTLCVKCNARVNVNRNEWQEYFQEKLLGLYNYQYLDNKFIEQEEKGGNEKYGKENVIEN